MKCLGGILKFLNKSECVIMVIAFALMVVCMFGSVLARNVFKVTIPWFDELARIGMIYMVMLAAEAGLRDGTQVCVTVLTDKLHGRAKDIVALIAQMVLVWFAALMTWTSVQSVINNIKRGVITTALKWPIAIPYTALVLGFGAMFFVQTGVLFRRLVSLFSREEEHKAE